jgi:hypothetical protein
VYNKVERDRNIEALSLMAVGSRMIKAAHIGQSYWMIGLSPTRYEGIVQHNCLA